jgi:hypothetical protein
MRKEKIIVKERRDAKKTYRNVRMYIFRTQTRTVTCYKRPPTNETATVLATAKIWLWVPEGLNAKRD